MPTTNAIENSFKVLSEIHQKITFADSKANFLVIIDLALFASIITILTNLKDSFKILLSHGPLGGGTIASFIIFSVITLFLVSASIFRAIQAINPRVSSQSKKQSLIYFGAIANMSYDDFKSFFQKGTEAELHDDLTNQIYENSLIANIKFGKVSNSARFLLFSLIFVGILAIASFLLTIII